MLTVKNVYILPFARQTDSTTIGNHFLISLVLIYMSIHDVIADLTGKSLLLQIVPSVPGSNTVREMLASKQLHRFLCGPWETKDLEICANRSKAYLDAFIQGQVITVACDPYRKPKSTMLARIAPTGDEVWDFRCRAAKPAVRVLGLFAKQDLFIALTYEYRKNLGGHGSKEWRDARERCKAAWRGRFPSYQPLSGSCPDDYLTNYLSV